MKRKPSNINLKQEIANKRLKTINSHLSLNLEHSDSEEENSFSCGICTHTIREAFVTQCGHSCISEYLQNKKHCPTCLNSLLSNQIFPNFMLNKLIKKAISSNVGLEGGKEIRENVPSNLITLELLLAFLQKSKKQQDQILRDVVTKLKKISVDEATIKDELNIVKEKGSVTDVNLQETKIPENDDAFSVAASSKDVGSPIQYINEEVNETKKSPGSTNIESPKNQKKSSIHQKVQKHFSDLQECYFSQASDEGKIGMPFTEIFSKFWKYSKLKTVANLHYADSFFINTSSIVSSIEFDKDGEFFATAGVTRKIKIFEYANVVYNYKEGRANDLATNFITSRNSAPNSEKHYSSRSSFSSPHGEDPDGNALDDVDEFNSDEDHAPGAGDGITRYPIQEISCRSKISCLSWNSYIKNQLLSSDYEGVVSLWDSNTGGITSQFNEHEKRAWSVDFSLIDPLIFASGGDDSKDHHIHYYDLRNVSQPLFVLKGHRKAVSYVKFIDKGEMVSASTDCTLKLWDIKKSVDPATKALESQMELKNTGFSSASTFLVRPTPSSILQFPNSETSESLLKSFQGHLNERNFVGLSVNNTGDYVACGSETNEVYIYFKNLPKPIITYSFGNPIDSITGQSSTEEDPNQFVSSVCWQRNTQNVLVTANSQGRIKVLEMS
ncbi:RING finger and WD repeat domain-containing protein 2 [Clydaea vesicula]|uniref:RING finger and WD repeat domain-containing protein 2 n=1 Tax=Clydaea vesicula TaxID=447962 RepID=A0AAD5UAQ8_9FUNG|nr:RING finger and WD repeat domain-containing protein 2 [Clydaea vesicula]